MAGMRISDAYIITQMWNLPPGMENVKLKQAFDDFIDHPNGMMFRTVFILEPTLNEWLQVLIRPGVKRMEWTNITVGDEQELETYLAEYQQDRAIAPFSDGELLSRVRIFEVNGYARVLVWSLHHALTDHWSLESVTSDIERIYTNSPLPFRRPFKSMVKYLHNLDRAGGLEFWRRHLHGASPTPFLQRQPEIRRVNANAVIFRNVSLQYGVLTRQFGIMVSTLVTCAWSIVLSAHSNITDVIFGQVLAGRSEYASVYLTLDLTIH